MAKMEILSLEEAKFSKNASKIRFRTYFLVEKPYSNSQRSNGTTMEITVQDDIHIIKIAGSILQSDSEELDRNLSEHNFDPSPKIIIDLTEVNHICSTALGIIVSYKKKFKSAEGDIIIVINDEDLLQLFEITMLDKVFKIVPNIEDAFDEFKLNP
ncbi:STAS domain protein [Leptospira interrogans serovar Icterohaemorrhagiae str. Verdun HP]|nr:anti-sigma factor antagonist [Leptospira interrogans serovar Copenhageni str. Fiocruz L1-130]EMG20214.1 STAS domain protein [Leptospira interrogans serovar Copenhageni str. LT2050]EMO07079.1 STAS domain protein [Leptospira interrogans serovar Icterohaemorrhagiae str. Verdun HP]